MFLEPNFRQRDARNRATGWIEVICGCMFSGKTEELIRRLRRAQIAGQELQIFKPARDTRYHEESLVTHDKLQHWSTPVGTAGQIELLVGSCEVVGIDEAQFFDGEVVDVANRLANNGKRVIIAGLDMDYRGQPFGPMPQLLAIAEFVTKVHAICARSGDLASYSYRLTGEEDQVVLGEKERYEPRSRRYFFDAE